MKMNFEHTAKLAVIRSKLIGMKLHSALVGVKWRVVSEKECYFMCISHDEMGLPVIGVSDKTLATYSIDTIVIMFVHEFSHKIFKHLEKCELYFKTANPSLLSMMEFNIIEDYLIDEFLVHNTGNINLDQEIRITLNSHLKAMRDYFLDLQKKYIDTFEKTQSTDIKFKKLYGLMQNHQISNSIIGYSFIMTKDLRVEKTTETVDNIVNTIVMIKKDIIEMLDKYEESKSAFDRQNMSNSNQSKSVHNQQDKPDSTNDDKVKGSVNPQSESQENPQTDKVKESVNSQSESQGGSQEEGFGKTLDSIIDPTLPTKKSNHTNIIDENKDYQKEALNKIIEKNYNYCQQEEKNEIKERVEKINEAQRKFSEDVKNTDFEKLPEVLHDDTIVTTNIMAEELNHYHNKQFNNVLSKIYARVNSYGDNATKVEYVWKNPRSLMYLQDDYIIQDTRELEKTGKKKIAVYVDISGSMQMGAAKTVNAILKTFSKDLIDVDIWFWNEFINRRADGKKEPYKIEELENYYPASSGMTSIIEVYKHACDFYKNESELTVIVISDFDDRSDWTKHPDAVKPENNKHWQYLNVHIITKEYEDINGKKLFEDMNKILGVDNPMITTQILNF